MLDQSDQAAFFIIELWAVIIVGLVLGSFTTAIAHRVPRGIPWAFPTNKMNDFSAEQGAGDAHFRSACPHCHTILRFFDLVPIISWVFMRGKCRHCRAPIPYRYPLIELGVLLSVLACHQVFGLTEAFIFILLALPFLWALLVIDLEYLILPNHLVALFGVIGLIRLCYDALILEFPSLNLFDHALGFVVFPLFIWGVGWTMSRILKKEALGFGDVKFFAAVGIWLGASKLAVFCLFSGVFGVILALVWRVFKGEEVFPFGPALIAAFFAILLLEQSDILRFLEM